MKRVGLGLKMVGSNSFSKGFFLLLLKEIIIKHVRLST